MSWSSLRTERWWRQRARRKHKLGAQFVQVLRPLEESVRLIDSAADTQERAGWSPGALCRPQGAPADAVDQILACARSLRGDVRQAVAFIRGNAPLIFRRRASVIPERGSSPPGGPRAGLMGDYDYVCLQTSGSLAEEGEDVPQAGYPRNYEGPSTTS